MAKPQSFESVISIEQNAKIIRFATMLGNDKNTLDFENKQYITRKFDEEFFGRFSELLGEFASKNPSEQSHKITIVVPDTLVLNEIVPIPTMNKKSMSTALELTINQTYKNHEELKINKGFLAQNQQFTTYHLSLMRRDIITKFHEACAVNKMVAQNITFASNSTVNALASINPKMMKSSYILLDIKETYSRFIFVTKGRTVGNYTVPFGASTLRASRVVAEDMLFNHPTAELAVLNAKEKARAKQITINHDTGQYELMEDSGADELDQALDAEQSFTLEGATPQPTKTLGAKTARKLPKFMLRPVAQTKEDVCYENFRIFVKWLLITMEANKKITSFVNTDTVLVNLPEEYSALMDRVNEEEKENKIRFSLLDLKDENQNVIDALELYGGFFIPKPRFGGLFSGNMTSENNF